MTLKDIKELKEDCRASIPAVFKEQDINKKYTMSSEVLDKIDQVLTSNDLWDSSQVFVNGSRTTNNHNIKRNTYYIEFFGFGVRRVCYFKINAKYDTETLIGVDLSIEYDKEDHERKALFNALTVSTSKNGRYKATQSEINHKWGFEFEGFFVPFKAVLNSNDKIKGIRGISFTTAKECPSREMGLCQLPNDKYCYALSGESRATRRDNHNGEMGMDSILNSLLSGYFWDIFKESEEVRASLFDYLEAKGIDTLRFNLKGDFRDAEDIAIINYLANNGLRMVGYTARDDLAEDLEELGANPNVFLNGSNRMYTNHFRATADLQTFAEANHQCKGGCLKNGCMNCYKLRGEVITVLIHGKESESLLNTFNNRYFVAQSFGLNPEDLEGEALGLVTNLNKSLGADYKTTKEALKDIGVI